jgi:amylosucrase
MIENFNSDLQEKAKKIWPDFLYIYKTLYPKSSENDLLALIYTMNTAYSNRKDSLKAIDKKREQDSHWYLAPKWVATMFYVDLYAGNIPSIADHLSYLTELGINYIHLMPLLEPREGQADGGYAVKNFRKVNPALGNNQDLIDLIEKMHQKDLIIAIDFVMNHTATEHPWAQSVLKGEEDFSNYYYLFPDRNLPDQFEKNLPEVFPDFAPGNFTYQEKIDKWVWTTFNEYQWDLNYSEPVVFHAMLGEMLFLANLGVDVLRLDAVPFLWKKIGTNCQNQEEAVMLLVAYKYLIHLVAPGILFKSEAIVAPHDIIRYLGAGGYEGKACEIGYNATLMNHLWHAIACENTHLLRTTLSKLPQIPTTSTWINYIRCHDDIGWGISDQNAADVGQNGHETRMFCSAFYTGRWHNSFAQGYDFQIDKSNGESRISGSTAALIGVQKAIIENKKEELISACHRFKLLHGILFFMKGIPLVYAGDEIGHLNNFEYLKEETKREDNRWLHRPKMDWEKASLRKRNNTIENKLFSILSNFAVQRKKNKCLHGLSDEKIVNVANDGIFCVEKAYQGERLLLVSNFSKKYALLSKKDLPIYWHNTCYQEEINNQKMIFSGDDIIIPPYEIFWLSLASFESKKIITYPLETNKIWTQPGESVYFVENKNNSSPEKNFAEKIACLWKDNGCWHVEINLNPGTWISYYYLKMSGQEILEKTDDLYFYAAEKDE